MCGSKVLLHPCSRGSCWRHVEEEAYHDERTINFFAMSFGMHIDRAALLARLKKRAEHFVEKHWKDIEKVALALLDHETLGRDELLELLK